MEHEVKVGHRDAILVISRRRSVRLSGIGPAMAQAFGEVYGYAGAHGAQPSGPPFVIYHGMPSDDDPFDIEVCAPVARAVGAPEGWAVTELPAGTFATLLHVGPYDTIGAAYSAMMAWVEASSVTVVGPPREVYLSEPDTPPERIRTVVEFPIAEAPVPAAG
ncbi:MAG: GyrI-like domain-containing protein [Chloroflexi bacterium]|nr:GyrI-like domain-containing protein [Chloroflexota bacterium]